MSIVFLEVVDEGHQVLKGEVHREDDNGQNDRGYHHDDGRILQLVPSRPSNLVRQLRIGLFKIICKLTHLYL